MRWHAGLVGGPNDWAGGLVLGGKEAGYKVGGLGLKGEKEVQAVGLGWGRRWAWPRRKEEGGRRWPGGLAHGLEGREGRKRAQVSIFYL